MTQAAWEAALDQALDVAEQCGVSYQEWSDYALDVAEGVLPKTSESVAQPEQEER